jgi:hypothetical protein
LGSFSHAGWHLTSFGFPGAYYFRTGEPRHYVYRLDDQDSRMKDRQTYLQLFQETGWEHVGRLAPRQYFDRKRRPANNQNYSPTRNRKLENMSGWPLP